MNTYFILCLTLFLLGGVFSVILVIEYGIIKTYINKTNGIDYLAAYNKELKTRKKEASILLCISLVLTFVGFVLILI